MDQINLNSLLHPGSLPRTEKETLKNFLPSDREPKPLHQQFLDSAGITVNPKVVEEARLKMGNLLSPSQDVPNPPPTLQNRVPFSSVLPVSGSPAQLATLLPLFIDLKTEIEKELQSTISRLMSLNPSRREAIAYYLDRLAGHSAAPSAIQGNTDAAGGLRRWVEGPRSPAQNLALQIYFEEIALITLGQSLLLKVWSDRGYRPWSPSDLKDLNWALNTAIKKYIPHDRETWHIARQNTYSWYKPSEHIQSQIWATTSSWKIHNEGPGFLPWIFSPTRAYRCENMAPQGYDPRFYQAIWKHLPEFGFDLSQSPGPIKRNWMFFSPTLRDGALLEATPSTVTWIGTETSSFNLMTAELMELWMKPSTPPLWSIGAGLDAHASDQLSLGTGYSTPKPSLISRIAEMEACDITFVLEERAIRLSGKNPEAQRLRESIEKLPFFKKLRSVGTTLGDLQACVSLSKLRPGGLLWWAREEPLTESDGTEMLNFMLERAKLFCEWDFSQLEHSLPTTKPAFPRYLYLFSRETGVESRLTHRPTRITVQGQIRSHVEIPFMLREVFAAYHGLAERSESRGQWKLHVQKSPTCQREWSERWPDPTCQATIRNLERIRENSVPLANATTIRPWTEGPQSKDLLRNSYPWLEGAKEIRGIWIYSEQNTETRRLRATIVSESQAKDPSHSGQPGSGFFMLAADEGWLAPLGQYLESETVRMWLDHHAERKGDRWLLTEQLVKCIPVPRSLLTQLGFNFASAQENAVSTETLKQASLFIDAAHELKKLHEDHGAFLSLITSNGTIRWGQLLKMLPPAECVAAPLHSKIRMLGNLPLHLAIGRFERIQSPSQGILFTTEAGFHLCLASDSSILLDMIWDQLEGLTSPTWSELVTHLRLPRRLELAEVTASDLLKMHGEQSRRIHSLSQQMSSCTLF